MDGRIDGWMNGRMDGRMEGWLDGRMDGWADGWLDGWMDGWMDGWADGWMDGWMDGCLILISFRLPSYGHTLCTVQLTSNVLHPTVHFLPQSNCRTRTVAQ